MNKNKIQNKWWLLPCVFAAFLVGCNNETSIYDSPVVVDDNSHYTADLIPVNIICPDSNAGEEEPVNDSVNIATRGGDNEAGNRLIDEWVKVNYPVMMRTVSEGPAIASMELVESPSSSGRASTRALMSADRYFRVIAFQKEGTKYTFKSVADYTSGGSSAPVLQQGKLAVPKGTIRFIAYSFNNTSALGAFPGTYEFGSSSIAISNLASDFMTYDSGDVSVDGSTYSLSVGFTQMLCQLTIKFSVTGFSSNTWSNCTGVYVKQGGASSSWVLGSSGVSANTSDTAPFSISDNSNGTVRLVPFAAARTISVYFGTLVIGGKTAGGTEIVSSQSVKLLAGKSYTMTVRFKKGIGNNVPAADISGTSCTGQDKIDLAKLTWADANLKSTGSSGYVWGTTATDFGYYYKWYSSYVSSNTDPCTLLNSSIYGTGWRNFNHNEGLKLLRCTKADWFVGNNGVDGMWFMNNVSGMFLPAAGYRTSGAGTVANNTGMKIGRYWNIDSDAAGKYGNSLLFTISGAGLSSEDKTLGFSIRCVKGAAQ